MACLSQLYVSALWQPAQRVCCLSPPALAWDQLQPPWHFEQHRQLWEANGRTGVKCQDELYYTSNWFSFLCVPSAPALGGAGWNRCVWARLKIKWKQLPSCSPLFRLIHPTCGGRWQWQSGGRCQGRGDNSLFLQSAAIGSTAYAQLHMYFLF